MKKLVLFSDAKASKQRFGICDKNGNPVWHGRFFENERDFNGEQSSGELAAAKKAVWLASKVKEAIGEDDLFLELRVDAEWLTWANEVGHKDDQGQGGKARVLGSQAKKFGIKLEVVHISGKENPADEFTTCTGYKKWSDNNLVDLVDEA